VRHARSSVVVELAEDSEYLQLFIQDDGDGVAEGDRGRLFEPFFRGGTERSSGEGTGLGLAIARTIARAHDGDLSLLPQQPNAGARFMIRLPLRAQS
jgi:signal transduction histidine kinase